MVALVEKKRREIKADPWQLAKLLYPDYEFKDFHREWFHLGYYDKDEEDLCLGPRNFAKTTVRAVIRAISKIIENPNIQLGICSDTGDQAIRFARETKMHLERNKLLRAMYPYIAPGYPWTDNEFNVIGADKIKKTATVTAISYGKSITGSDFDDITIDDIVDFENSRTKYQREKLHDWLGMTLIPMLKKGGNTHWNGTRYHHKDEYSRLLEQKIKTNRNSHRAMIDEKGKSVLWPEMYPFEWLMKKKNRVGSIIFNAQWQNDTELMKIGKIFHREWFKYFDKTPEGDFKDIDGHRFNYSDLAIYQTCDLAISKSDKADYFVILTYGLSKEGNFYIFDIRRGRYSWAEQKTLSKTNYVRWRINGLRWMGIETKQYQRVLADEMDVFPDMSVRHLEADKDKVTRAMPMSAKYESGKVYHYAKMDVLEEFEDELCSFDDGEFDDMVDCVAYMPRCSTREKSEIRIR